MSPATSIIISTLDIEVDRFTFGLTTSTNNCPDVLADLEIRFFNENTLNSD